MELTISVVALILSLASLAWQAAIWKLSGPRVVVATALAREAGHHWFLQVTITNKGRFTAQVRNIILVDISGKGSLDLWSYARGIDAADFPLEIAPHCCRELVYDASAITSSIAHHLPLPWRASLEVLLGTGKSIRGGTLVLAKEMSASQDTQRHEERIGEVIPALRERRWRRSM